MTTTITPEQAAAEDDNLPEVDSIIFGELIHLPLPGKELRMAAMQVRAALHRHGHLARRAAVPSEQEPVAYLIEDSPVRGIRAIVWPGELQRAMEEEPQAKTTPLYAHPSEQEPVAWRSWAGAPGAVSVKRPDGVEAHTVVETIDTDGRRAISRADRVNWNIELSEDGVWVTHWRFAHPAPAAGVNEADWQPDALSALNTGEPK